MEIYKQLPPEAVQILLVLFLSFLIGLEREEHSAAGKYFSFGGVRTFPLIGLIGYSVALVSGQQVLPVTLGFLVVGGFLLVSYWHKLSKVEAAWVTTEMSGLATFLIGALIVYRIGTYIPVPGIDPRILGEIFARQQGGVLGVLPGLLGVIQATEVIKLVLAKGDPLIGRLLLVDALAMRFRELKLKKNPECPVCGENPTVTRLIDYQQFCGLTPNSSQEKTLNNGIPQITVQELKQHLDAGDDIMILDVREPHEYQIANIGGTLIPQNQVPQRLAEIDRNREIVVQCRSGARSQRIAEFLASQGYPNVKNLAGGILAWADQIDPTVTKY